jgi:hypothetical protein
MMHLQVTYKGDNLLICRVPANILNKQLWIAEKMWSSRMGTGQGANNFSL